ncbi:MAG: hypothetical protein AB7V62_17900 [Thermoleophilia bacterium]
MRRLATLAAALAVVMVAAPAALGAGWAKVSGDDVSGIDQAALVVNGGRVVAAWPSGSGSDLAGAVAFRGWAPTPAASLAGAGPTATAAGGYTNISARPGLIVAPTGLHVITSGVIAGQSRTYQTPPLTEGAPGGPATQIADQLTGPIDAVALSGGGVIVANMMNGSVRTFRDSTPGEGFEIQELLGGPAGYNPAVGQDGTGRVWLAWYSNASGNIGIFMLQIDPATGAPVGAPALVPQSQSPANNGFHLALACSASACRIVYGAQAAPTAPLRLASWAPGEAAPTNIGGARNLSLGLPLTAAYRADGRLWVAWYDLGTTRGFYAAKLGNARGAGGTVQDLGRPAGAAFVDDRNLDSVVVGTDLVLAGTVVTTAPRASLWTTYVQDPATIIENPRTIRNGPATITAPRRISIGKLRRSKCVNVKVAVTEPARVLVQIYSGPKSRRLFGQRIVAFTAPGTKYVCVRVPFRAKTFNPRAPAGILVAVRKGNARGNQGPPARVVTRGVRFF